MEGRRGKEESVVWRCHCRELIKAKAISENSICVCNKESNNPENKELKAWSDLYRCRSISHAILFDSPIRIIDRIGEYRSRQEVSAMKSPDSPCKTPA